MLLLGGISGLCLGVWGGYEPILGPSAQSSGPSAMSPAKSGPLVSLFLRDWACVFFVFFVCVLFSPNFRETPGFLSSPGSSFFVLSVLFLPGFHVVSWGFFSFQLASLCSRNHLG